MSVPAQIALLTNDLALPEAQDVLDGLIAIGNGGDNRRVLAARFGEQVQARMIAQNLVKQSQGVTAWKDVAFSVENDGTMTPRPSSSSSSACQ